MVEDLVEVVLGVDIVDGSLEFHQADHLLLELVELVGVVNVVNGSLQLL